MQVRIDLVEQYIDLGIDKGPKQTFGISVSTEDGKVVLKTYPDISYSKHMVEKFISMLVRNDVSLVHIDEMIDDYFYSV